MENKEKIEAMDGQEIWTNAFGKRFGERVCVMVEGEFCWKEGKKFKPTQKEIKELWDDYVTQELGSPAQRAKDLELEFGEKAEQEWADHLVHKGQLEAENRAAELEDE